MLRLACGLAAFWAATATAFAAEAEVKRAPFVAEGGVVNAAGFFLPDDQEVALGGIVSIFGTELAPREREALPSDLRGGRLPEKLANVTVIINSQPAPLYFVSPNQINCQIPLELRARDQPYELIVVNRAESNPRGNAGVRVVEAAPGLFPVVAHTDFTIVGRGEPPGATPARPGETVVLFGAGFGPTERPNGGPPLATGELARTAARLTLPATVLLDGEPLPPEALLYVGQAPGFAGLYQANVTLPDTEFVADPEVVIEIAGRRSAPGLRIAVDAPLP